MEFAQPRNCMLNGTRKGFALIFCKKKQMLKTHGFQAHTKTLDALFVSAMFRKKGTPHVLFLELYMFIASKKNRDLEFCIRTLIESPWIMSPPEDSWSSVLGVLWLWDVVVFWNMFIVTHTVGEMIHFD